MRPMTTNLSIPTRALPGACPERMIASAGLLPEGATQDTKA